MPYYQQKRPKVRFIGSADNGATAVSNINVSVPTGTRTGHMMIGAWGSDDGGGASAEPGWNSIDNLITGSTMGLRLAWRIAHNEPTAYTFDFGSSANNAGHIQTWECDGDNWELPKLLNQFASDIQEANPGTTLANSPIFNVPGGAVSAFYASDGGQAISSGPLRMVQTAYRVAGSFGIAGYYEEDAALGLNEKSLTFDTSDQMQAVAVVVAARPKLFLVPKGAAVGGSTIPTTIIPRYYRQLMAQGGLTN